MSPSLSVAVTGFMLGASLIIAIGAQNAFVLRQGLRREHVLAVVTLCALVDAVLIALGVAGFGRIVARYPAAVDVAAVLGALYLLVHAGLAARSALRPSALLAQDARHVDGKKLLSVVASTLAVSLLNPHVYLDTVVLLGSVSAQYPPADRVSFAVGAMTASVVWFFSLGFGARLLAPLFARPIAWRILDGVIAVIMVWVAGSLVSGLIS